MRTSLAEAEGWSAFEGELQAVGSGQLYVAAGTGWFDHAEHHAVTAFVFRHGLDADTSTHKHAGTPGYTARKIAERTVIF